MSSFDPTSYSRRPVRRLGKDRARTNVPVAHDVVPFPSDTPVLLSIVDAARDFLRLLDADDRLEVLACRAHGERRQGLLWDDLPEHIQLAWLDVMQVTLFHEEHERIVTAWASDTMPDRDDPAGTDLHAEALLANEGFRIAIHGAPSVVEEWRWVFGGQRAIVRAAISPDGVSLACGVNT